MTDEKRAEIERLAADYVEKKVIVERMSYQPLPNDLELRKQVGVAYEVAVAELNEAEGLLREAQKYVPFSAPDPFEDAKRDMIKND
jgi:hypothetical protein